MDSREEINALYADRNRAVQLAAYFAVLAGFTAGVRLGTEEDNWPVITICLPDGEIGWHVPVDELLFQDIVNVNYDGHDDAEKARRIAAFIPTHFREH